MREGLCSDRDRLRRCLAAGWIFRPAVVSSDQTPIGTPGDSAALLAEVRRLCEAIEALAGTGARVQIVFGRVQLQEQRTAAADRRLDDLRGALAVATDRVSDLAERMKEIEGSWRSS